MLRLMSRIARRPCALLALLVAAVATTPQSSGAQRPTSADWPVYGGDPGGMKSSAVTQINRDNVRQLEPVWSWRTGEKPLAGPRLPIPGNEVRPASFEVTPNVLDNT